MTRKLSPLLPRMHHAPPLPPPSDPSSSIYNIYQQKKTSSPAHLYMFARFLVPSRVLLLSALPLITHLKTHFPAFRSTFPATRNARLMASGGQFPPQKQEGQPGKEHVMDPNPQFINPDYKPANKLQVLN